jgi:hypothetical protein
LHQNGLYRWQALKNIRIMRSIEFEKNKNNLASNKLIKNNSITKLILNDVMIAFLIITFGFFIQITCLFCEIIAGKSHIKDLFINIIN